MQTLYSTKQFMEKLGVSRTTLYRFINDGTIEPLHVGGRLRFTDEHMKAILQASEPEKKKDE